MDTTTIIAIVVICALVVLGVAAFFAYRQKRSKELREQFGPEYDRTVEQTGSRGKAEKVLEERRERVNKLHIVPLSKESRERYADRWRKIQARFVDDPPGAILEADDAIKQVMQERGYPTGGDFDQRLADISVEHADVADHYRAAHTIRMRAEQGGATTEELRTAMQHYKALFENLLEMHVRVEA